MFGRRITCEKIVPTLVWGLGASRNSEQLDSGDLGREGRQIELIKTGMYGRGRGRRGFGYLVQVRPVFREKGWSFNESGPVVIRDAGAALDRRWVERWCLDKKSLQRRICKQRIAPPGVPVRQCRGVNLAAHEYFSRDLCNNPAFVRHTAHLHSKQRERDCRRNTIVI